MDKDNFNITLKQLREERKLSQGELADVLSNSHRAFSGINQVMVSHWERAKATPSFVRRIGLASFFQVDYNFSIDEMAQLKPAMRLMSRPVNNTIAYDYNITDVVSYSFHSLPEFDLQMIQSMHVKLYGVDFNYLIKKAGFSLEEITVICFQHKGLLIGHFAYEKNTKMLVSLGASSVAIRRQIFEYLSNSAETRYVSFPTLDPAMSQFLYDLYLEPCCHRHGFIHFRGDIKKILENPFALAIQSKHDAHFKYVRYSYLKQKNKSVEYTLA
ncbi:helix-turn-helix transcriptional regulator [Vibrio coralliilyticus]|uniref:helix-turn-helix transcriptional regulator n=1 Tax=Vibrio coralliilyticus TaxID=190893 RepID=UPI002FD5D61B